MEYVIGNADKVVKPLSIFSCKILASIPRINILDLKGLIRRPDEIAGVPPSI
jgi:hypothetical protein